MCAAKKRGVCVCVCGVCATPRATPRDPSSPQPPATTHLAVGADRRDHLVDQVGRHVGQGRVGRRHGEASDALVLRSARFSRVRVLVCFAVSEGELKAGVAFVTNVCMYI